MSSITIKNLPVRLHRELKTRAAAHGRSLNKEILTCLEASLQSHRVDVRQLIEEARAVRGTVKANLTERDLSALKTAGRA
jgi:plasmid stability protein